MERKALFITFEGPEGAGKSTQIALLRDYLADAGYKVVITREPGGTPLAEDFRNIVKHYHGSEPLYPATELLLFEAARVQHINYVIKPALESGAIVLCDRFTDSTAAYQGAGRTLNMDFLQQLNAFAADDCLPDLTLLIDLPVEIGLARAQHRAEGVENHNDRLEEEKIDFHHRVRDAYLQIAENEPQRVKVLDGTLEIAELFEQVKSRVTDALQRV
ncbi:MAG: dTMP kinase [Lentisphaerae bacterium]|nr:dTMP kinase [Lentisphaerota bacterium]